MNVIHFFDRAVRQNPEAVCFVEGECSVSYRQAYETSCLIANALLSKGYGRGSRCAVLSPNSVRAFECVLGILRAGSAWIPLNVRSSLDEIARTLEEAECRVLFLHGAFRDRATMLRKRLSDPIEIVGFDGADGNSLETLDDLISGRSCADPDLAWSPDDVAFLPSTGGTTGVPKVVALTQKNIATLIASFLVHMPVEEPPVYLVVTPMTHAAGAICFPLLAQGAKIVIMRQADPEEILANIQRHRVTTLFMPPTLIYALLAHPDVRRYDYSSLRNFIYAAAPISVAKLREAIEIFGPVMTQCYGQAEVPMICTFLSPKEHVIERTGTAVDRLASCGRPSMFVQLAIMDGEGNRVPTNESGEIVVRGDLVMEGYLNNPAATTESRRFGWHHTGDIGFMDEDGYVYIVDRLRDMIITGGFNVYPTEVEQVIWSHPSVRDCAVIGVPDPYWGEAVTAFVELKAEGSVRAEDLLRLCKEKLGSVKTPKSIEFVSSLPRSEVGKVLKRQLRDRYWVGQGRQI